MLARAFISPAAKGGRQASGSRHRFTVFMVLMVSRRQV
jgi:hypothetical protein